MKTILTLILFIFLNQYSFADGSENIYPTWKLMKDKEKQQLMHGYRAGWEDFNKVLDIVEEFVQNNPEEAKSSIAQLKQIYSLPDSSVEKLVNEIDGFYKVAKNRTAPLSKALTSIKNK